MSPLLFHTRKASARHRHHHRLRRSAGPLPISDWPRDIFKKTVTSLESFSYSLLHSHSPIVTQRHKRSKTQKEFCEEKPGSECESRSGRFIFSVSPFPPLCVLAS